MKDLLYKLSFGISRDSLTKTEKKAVEELDRLGLIGSSANNIRLSANTVLGKVDIPMGNAGKKRNKFAFIVPINTNETKDFFVNESDLRGARNGDLVICKITGRDRNRKKVKVLYTAKIKQADLICVAQEINKKILLKEFYSGREIHTTSKQKSLKTLPKNCVVSVDFQSKEITDILGVLDDPHVDELIVLRRYNRYEEFSKEALLEADSFGNSIDKNMYPDRVDLTHLNFITIDPKTAKDYDDAIYFDKNENTLYVAIADVTEYVREFTALDKEAKQRGFSIYFPHKSVPMLPRSLSENLCSLNEKVDRLTFAFKIKFDERGNVESYELFEGIINSKRRFTYEEIDEIYDNKDVKKESDRFVLDSLMPLRDLVKIIRSKRLSKGYTFHTPDVRLELDEELELIGTEKEEDTFSHNLVEECMLLANICASKYFEYGIYRTHPAPERRGINILIQDLANDGIYVDQVLDLHKQITLIQSHADERGIREIVDKMIIKSLKRAEYSYENIGHFGLGFERYTHFTSPIRRYSDLILHRYLKAIIKKNKKLQSYINKDLQFTTKIVSGLEEETTKIMWDYEDFVYARWGKLHAKETFEGYIQDVGEPNKDTIIKLTNGAVGARVFCKFDKSLRLHNFQNVKVTIKTASMLSVRIFGEIELVIEEDV